MPTHCLLVRGRGQALLALEAFDAALVDAGVGEYNLVKVSSIFPPHCQFTDVHEVPEGTAVTTAFAQLESDDPTVTIAASIAVAVPKDRHRPGVIMEWHGYGDQAFAESTVIEMAKRAMARREIDVQEIRCVAIDGKATEGTMSVFAAAVLF